MMTSPRTKLLALAKTVGMLAALNVFFVAIKLLGAFKEIGSGYGETLMASLADRPVMGVLVGLLVTSIIQSSSTTTALVVGLVASGTFGEDPTLALRAAIPIIMGANIGTTVTNNIVAFGHVDDPREFGRAFSAATVHDIFNILTVAMLLPLQIATNFLGRISLAAASLLDDAGGLRFVSPLRHLVHPQVELVKGAFDYQALTDLMIVFALVVGTLYALGYLESRRRREKKTSLQALGVALVMSLVAVALKSYHAHIFAKPTAVFIAGLALLLLALWVIVKIMRSVVLVRVSRLFHDYVFKTTLRAIIVGMALTAIVQSSSVTTSIAVPLAGAGLLTIHQVYPYTLGANLGTTITALLAAVSLGEPTALAAALAHLCFNIFGMAVFLPLRQIPIRMAEGLSAVAQRWRAFPAIFVLLTFIILPLILILLGERS